MLEVFTAVGRAVADPNRVRILKMLQGGELCVCQITAILGLSSATESKHLSLLKMAGLVSQRKDGRWVFYRLAPFELNPYAPHMLSVLAGVLDDDPGVAADRDRLDQVGAVSAQILCRMGPNPFGEDGCMDAALLELALREDGARHAAAAEAAPRPAAARPEPAAPQPSSWPPASIRRSSRASSYSASRRKTAASASDSASSPQGTGSARRHEAK